MLIVLGGLPGSGRQKLTDRLAQKTGFHRYDLDSKKLKVPPPQPGAPVRTLNPRNATERVRLYKTALAEFPRLSKMHDNVVIDDLFHHRASREYFLAEAQKFFAPIIFVWVDADEVSAQKNIERMLARGKITSIEDTLRIRKRTQSRSEPPENALAFRFQSDIDLNDQAAALWELIQENI